MMPQISNRKTVLANSGRTTPTGERKKKKSAKKKAAKKPAKRSSGKTAKASKSGSRVVGCFEKQAGITVQIASFIKKYVVLPDDSIYVIACWIVSAWLKDSWNRFPHLAVTSPQMRCGKTTLLSILEILMPAPKLVSNIKPAGIYRTITMTPNCSILIDEAQSIKRLGNENSEVIRELLNSSIRKRDSVIRCEQEDGKFTPTEFSTYCPKAFALIGDVDPVLNDRCIQIRLKRKTAKDQVEYFEEDEVEDSAHELVEMLGEWINELDEEAIIATRKQVERFKVSNDRFAQLLKPLQTVVMLDNPKCMSILKKWAEEMDRKEQAAVSHDELLLQALREIVIQHTHIKAEEAMKERVLENHGSKFIPTNILINELKLREEEPWERITAKALSIFLNPFEIKSDRYQRKDRRKPKATKTIRGYYINDLQNAFDLYLKPLTPEQSDYVVDPTKKPNAQRGKE